MITHELAGIVHGHDAMDVAGSFDAMIKATRNAGRAGVVGHAISAVDVALWGLEARLVDLPLHHVLGAVHPKVPVDGSGGFTTYSDEQMRRQLAHWTADQRSPRVKIKIGESWGTNATRDVARIEQARSIIGDQADLFVDANGASTRKTGHPTHGPRSREPHQVVRGAGDRG
jgi:L-alanine-DL-glutamate epimerase-like enolase superfamily enzyme